MLKLQPNLTITDMLCNKTWNLSLVDIYLSHTIFCTKYTFAFKTFSTEVTIHSDNELDNVKPNFEPF